MRRIVIAFGLALNSLDVSAVCAQSSAPSFRQEFGLELGLTNYTQANESILLKPVSLRFGLYDVERPWEVQLRAAYSDHQSAANGRQVRIGADVTLVRRLSLEPIGGYVFGSSVWTMMAPNVRSRFGHVLALAVGVGRRILLGVSGTMRPEIAVQHNFPQSDLGGTFGAENEVQIRVGFSLLRHGRYGM